MPLHWVEFHAQNQRKNSRSLSPAAFPSLPLDQPPQEVAIGEVHKAIKAPSPEEARPEMPGPVATEHPDVLSYISRLAIQYYLGAFEPDDSDVGDQIRAECKRMIKDGVFDRPKPRSKKKGDRNNFGDQIRPKREVKELTEEK